MAETWLDSCLQFERHIAFISFSKRAIVDVDHYCECLYSKGTSDICREQHKICNLKNHAVIMFIMC